MRAYHLQLTTPFGPFACALAGSGAVLGTAFGLVDELRRRLPDGVSLASDPSAGKDVRTELEAYFAGRRRSFDVRVSAQGSPFQHKVWAALREIPWGETRTYGEIADVIGRPGAARAVGRANATNPVCVIVPCHRVIGANRTLTGFAFGPALKSRLLGHEGVVLG